MRTARPTFAPQPLPPDRRPAKGVFAKAVGSFVPKVTAKAFERFGFHSAEIIAAWPRVAGAELAGFTVPERIKWPRAPLGDAEGGSGAKGATLVLRVEPARALDVEYRSGEIIDRINRYFGYRAIAQLRIVQAPVAHAGQMGPTAGTPLSTPPNVVAADSAPIPETAEPGLKAALELLWASIGAERARR